ncbi:MAG: hypothetical protein HOY71_15725 [Nonomuraea sp.]|nr:hypothetical protein [Nonomuraea sp.]
MRAERLGVLLVLAALSSSCAVIPVGGPFQVEAAGGGDPMSKPFHRMVAVPPKQEWGPTTVVQGLQAAMAAYPNDRGMLQQYLTPDARRDWKLSGAVTVVDKLDFDSATPAANGKDEASVTLMATPVAYITTDDQYKPIQTPKQAKYTFKLTKTPNGWRVKDLQQGLLLSKADVDMDYRATNLYYLNGQPGGLSDPDKLVVDRVWLRVKPTESFAQTIVERLLKGPTGALQGAVGSVFPKDRMRVESIRLDDRVVINLSGDIDPEQVDLSQLQGQLRASLSNNNVVNGRPIEVQLDGEPFYSTETATIPPKLDDHWLDTGDGDGYYTLNGGLRHMPPPDRPEGEPVYGPAGAPNPDPTGFAVSNNGDVAAISQANHGIWVVPTTKDGRWEQWFRGEHLTPPSWSRDGSLWTYDADKGQVLRCTQKCANGAEQPTHVSAPSLVSADVTDLRIARDGVRVAARIGKQEVRIGALAYGDGMLSNVQTLVQVDKGEEIQDIAWLDGEHVLVLVTGKRGTMLNQVNVGDGTTEQVTSNNQMQSIAAYGNRVYAEIKEGKDSKDVIGFNLDPAQTPVKPLKGQIPIFALG